MSIGHIVTAVVFIALSYYAGTKGWLSKVTG
jgi:hypothetical protein